MVPNHQRKIKENESMEKTVIPSKFSLIQLMVFTHINNTNFIPSSSDRKSARKDLSPNQEQRLSTMAEEEEHEQTRTSAPQNLSQVQIKID